MRQEMAKGLKVKKSKGQDFSTFLILFTAYCLLVVGCVSPTKKKGVSYKRISSYERVLKRYPKSLYLVGEGEAGLSEENYKDVAENRARANMVKNIKVKIQEVITIKLVEKGGSIASSAQIFARSIVDSVELKGTEIVHSDSYESIYRAICIVSREDAAGYLKDDIDKSYKFSLISYRSVEPGQRLSITGNYWDLKDWVDINLYLKDKDYRVIASAETRIDKKPLEKEGLVLEPDSYEEVREKVDYLVGEASCLSTFLDLKIKVWTEKKVYKEGENLSIFLKATNDCYVRVYDYQSSGDVVCLFPNDYSPSGYIKGNRVYEIPKDFACPTDGRRGGFSLEIGPPFGNDVIKIYATKEPITQQVGHLASHYKGKAGPYSIYAGDYRGIERGIMVGKIATASCVITTVR